MKVLFIYTNINGFHEDCYSIGLASVISVTRLRGHEAKVIIVRTRQELQGIADKVAEFKPRVVGFSSVSSQFNFVKEAASLIKAAFQDVITICGGVHTTIDPGCVKETGSLDGVFVGESENSFAEFLERIAAGLSYKNTDNFAYASNNEVIINRLKPLISDLDTLPYPDKDVYPFKETVRDIGYAPFFFSRGCPFLCSYCSNHAIAKTYGLPRNYPRYRSPESSIREIEEAAGKFRIETILIGDDIFGLDKKWRIEFCGEYKKRIGIRFACLLRPDVIDDDFVRLLKDAGCYRVSIGVESGNKHIRNAVMNRHISCDQIIKAFETARKYKLRANAINIIGVPHEDESMIWDTIRLNRRIRPVSSVANIFYPYKGTRLGAYCFESNLVDSALYGSFSNERRETVLNYPPAHKKRLKYYRENWELLVYPFDVKRHLLKFARKSFIWKRLRRAKQQLGIKI